MTGKIICPICGEDQFLRLLGRIGTWECAKCDICSSMTWYLIGGRNKKQIDDFRRGQLYAAIERSREK